METSGEGARVMEEVRRRPTAQRYGEIRGRLSRGSRATGEPSSDSRIVALPRRRRGAGAPEGEEGEVFST
jgi:hypothetical protein